MKEEFYYYYNQDKYYYGERILAFEEPNNSTNIAPISFNEENEKLKFVNEEWIIEDTKANGDFYQKTNGALLNEIVKKNINLYTQIKPFDLNPGDVISFNGNVWIYNTKGEATLEKESLGQLETARKLKIQELEEIYVKSQICTILDGVDEEQQRVSFQVILRTGEEGDLGLLETQVGLSKFYGASMIIRNGLLVLPRVNENDADVLALNSQGKPILSGKSYVGYLTTAEWLSFYDTLIMKSRANWNVKNNMFLPLVMQASSLPALENINFNLGLDVNFKIILQDIITRNGGNIFLINNLTNSLSINNQVNAIKQQFLIP